MKIALKVIIVGLLLLALLFAVPSPAFLGFAEDASGDIIEIPMDAETAQLQWAKAPDDNPPPIPAPLEEGYLSETAYSDPSISVSITTGRWVDTDYTMAHVKIANASQIRSVVSGSYSRPGEIVGARLAANVNAVLAINGDFFSKRRNNGITIRQGKTMFMPKTDLDLAYARSVQYDILLIDDRGDLHILKECRMEDLYAFEGTVINAFTFGPGLVINGEKQSDFKDIKNATVKKTQRMAIAQVGPLEYLCICCEGPDDYGSAGLTMEEFAELVASQDNVVNAYNLDGGASSTMVFREKKINTPKRPGNRRMIVDLLYFASAYVPSETAGAE